MHQDGVVRPFSKMNAEGNKIFKDIDKGKYVSTDQFAYFEIIIENKEVIILTNYRLIYAVKNDLFGGWQVRKIFLYFVYHVNSDFVSLSNPKSQSDWIHKWDEIQESKVCDKGVELQLVMPKQKSSFSKMFSSSDKSKKILFVQNRKRAEKLVSVMENLRSRYGK